MEEVPDYPNEQGEKMTKRSEAPNESANQAPAALPREVMDSPLEAEAAVERALHLRVLAAMLGGQGEETRIEQALALAQEVYELELVSASLEDYRSS
jgi:hypothetical protein